MFQSTRFGASVTGLCCGLVGLVSVVNAETVTVNPASPYMWGDGGEFILTPHGFAEAPLSLTNDGNFQSFCFQSQVEIALNHTYGDYVTDLLAPGGPGLTEQTAFLYDQFIRGVLPGYDYTNALGQRQIDAGALQFAIWNLEGQDTSGLMFDPNPTLTGIYVTLANAVAVPGEFYNVKVLVMYNGSVDDPSYVQSMLVELPRVPSAGAGALFALGGLVATRRRRGSRI